MMWIHIERDQEEAVRKFSKENSLSYDASARTILAAGLKQIAIEREVM